MEEAMSRTVWNATISPGKCKDRLHVHDRNNTPWQRLIQRGRVARHPRSPETDEIV
jgi:hypothetical protein